MALWRTMQDSTHRIRSSGFWSFSHSARKKNFLCSVDSLPHRSTIWGHVKCRRIDMRFISIFTHEPTDRPPTEAEMASMGKLIEGGMKAGWLIATEGVHFGATGVRVHKSA